MLEGIFKSNISGLVYSQFMGSTVEPSALTNKLWVDVANDLYYNKTGVGNILLSAASAAIWQKIGTEISTILAGDSLKIDGYVRSDLGLKDQYVLIPVPIGESFSSFDNLGLELISNGDFSGGSTDWTEGSAWSIGAGKASVDTTDADDLSQSAPPLTLTAGTWYTIQFDIIDVAAGGTITPKLTGVTPVVGTPQDTDTAGTYIQYLLATSDSLTGLAFTSNILANGASIGNISIKPVISFLSSLFSSDSIIGALNELARGDAGNKFSDNLFEIYNNLDDTASFQFNAGLISPTSNRTITIPDKNITLDFIQDNGTNTNATEGSSLMVNSGRIISNSFSFSAANDQATPDDVLGLLFSSVNFRAFTINLCVYIDATAPLTEYFTIEGVYYNTDWHVNVTSVGQTSNISFSITSAGQIQYTSGNEAGFVSSTFKWSVIKIPS